ncbi:hypothetical protein DPMN_089801 [Dreissena polymorpha]|uniref:Uncharacterized protein n=1 Tax=Dreissena polymorpha TaxID=45954 RepID=A0A9D4KX33_DREPO|nr:hypothetical protein DPMN_089801 [Dreissena polymorpha]
MKKKKRQYKSNQLFMTYKQVKENDAVDRTLGMQPVPETDTFLIRSGPSPVLALGEEVKLVEHVSYMAKEQDSSFKDSPFAHLRGCLQTKCGRTDSGHRPILKPHLSNQCSITRKTAHPPGNHFHDDWAKNMTSRVNVIQLTGTIFQLNSQKCPAHWRPCFFTDMDHFELVRHINKANVLINFHDDWAKIVTSRVFTRKTALPTGGHVFQRTGTTFELNQHIIITDIQTKLHEDWALNVTSTVFKLDRDFIGTNLLTKFHEDRTINVASRVFTNKCGRTDDGQRPVTKAH